MSTSISRELLLKTCVYPVMLPWQRHTRYLNCQNAIVWQNVPQGPRDQQFLKKANTVKASKTVFSSLKKFDRKFLKMKTNWLTQDGVMHARDCSDNVKRHFPSIQGLC